MSYDAIIIGAGPAGCSAALALAGMGRRVAIIEQSPFPRKKVCGEFMSAVNFDLLDRLGVGAAVRARAGPNVCRVALFASGPAVEAGMPRAPGAAFGRALGRDVLDSVLLQAAADAGAAVFQPWQAIDVCTAGATTGVRVECAGESRVLTADAVIAAHGSWTRGPLPSQLERQNRRQDFFGFKAHFKGASLAADLMPLLVFEGGYGGMVWADQGRLSLSCCIRRDALARVRDLYRGPAAQAVFAHILSSCPAARMALGGAALDGAWLAAGPIRPGIRASYAADIFRVGNIAGECHPVIAEGIAMALQSGWLLACALARHDVWDARSRVAAGRDYSVAWRRQFSTRIAAAAVLARLAILPRTAGAMQAVVRALPSSLSFGARLSGKTKAVPECL
ncbi:MAG: FAD-dependent monooxygenase [Methylocella sp.]